MKQFLILFMGLISHFSFPRNHPAFERAVLVEHDFHMPVLMLREKDFAEPTPSVDLNRIECPKANADEPVRCYSLVDVQLRFEGLDKGVPSPIDVHIPKLSTITDSKKPSKAVKDANVKSPHAFSYIDYTGGCLIAPIYARYEMEWSPNGCKSSPGPSCVTPDVLYAGTARETAVTVEIVQPAGRRPFKLNPDAFVVVEVIPQGAHGMLEDYKQYRSLMNNATCIGDMKEVIVDSAPKECPSALPMPCLRTPNPLDNIRYLDSLTLRQLIERYNLQAGCTNSSGGGP